MARRVLDVFLSSTARDLAHHRDAVYNRLKTTGLFHCIRQEDFGPQNADAVDFCCRNVQASDMFVGLVGLRRGWEPDGDNKKRSITEMEHDWAREAGSRRFLWVSPDDFPVPGDLRESDSEHERQQAFRKRTMAGGERIVSQKGFATPELLASAIVERLQLEIITTDLIALLRPEMETRPATAPANAPAPSIEDQKPAIAAAVEQLAADKDIDLLELARNPAGLDVADLEAKLKARAEAHEAEGHPLVDQGTRALQASAEYWRHLGALAFLHDTAKALTAYEKATVLDPANAGGWCYLGELRFRRGEIEAAETAFDALLKIGVTQADKRAQTMACMRLGWIFLLRGQLTEAEEFQTEAARLAGQIEWTEGLARAYANLGVIHQTRGNLAQAEEFYLKSLRLDEELGRKEGIAAAYANLGVIHQTRGDLAQAEVFQLKSLKLEEELGSKQGLARAYGNLGVIHQTRGNLAQAEEFYLKSLRLEEELGRKQGIAAAYGNLGVIHQIRGDLAQAEVFHLKSLKLNDELGRKEGIAATYANLGIIYDARNDRSRTCEYWRKARDLYREMGLAEKAAELDSWLKHRKCPQP